MSDVSQLLWLIPALPLAAAVLTAFLGPKVLSGQSHWPCILGSAAACVLSILGSCDLLRATTSVTARPLLHCLPGRYGRRIRFAPTR